MSKWRNEIKYRSTRRKETSEVTVHIHVIWSTDLYLLSYLKNWRNNYHSMELTEKTGRVQVTFGILVMSKSILFDLNQMNWTIPTLYRCTRMQIHDTIPGGDIHEFRCLWVRLGNVRATEKSTEVLLQAIKALHLLHNHNQDKVHQFRILWWWRRTVQGMEECDTEISV